MTRTNQEIFDKVADHLLTQQARSDDGHGVCLYRGAGGMKCAVGIFIPDAVYDIAHEKMGIRSLPLDFEPTNTQVSLLRVLQAVHDDGEPHNWPEDLKRCAADWDLVWRDRDGH